MDNESHNGEDAREKKVEEQEYSGRQKNISASKQRTEKRNRLSKRKMVGK